MPMESRIPLPTDNIYKFYALFGLLLFIFSFGSLLYLNRTTNELVFQAIIENESLKHIANPSPVEKAREQVLQKRVELAIADKNFSMHALAVITLVALASMAIGFWKWHRDVQPVQDEIAELQLKKLRHEVSQLTAPTPPPTPPPQDDSKEDED